MNEKIYVRDLKCYKTATEERRKKTFLTPKRYFDLSKLPTEGLRRELRNYIEHRGEVLTLSSLRAEFWKYNRLSEFLSCCYPQLESFANVEYFLMDKKLRGWMLANGYSLFVKKYSRQAGKEKTENSDIIRYLNRVYHYNVSDEDVEETKKDIWVIEKLEFPVSDSPHNPIKTIDFRKIPQISMREEMKQAMMIHLTYLKVRTVKQQIHAAQRMAKFLQKEYPSITSFTELSRDVLEEYLIYLNTEVTGKKNFHSELSGLKSTFWTIGKIKECDVLTRIFLQDDIPKGREQPPFEAYSDNEVIRLNSEIVKIDEQVARAIILHQMLGNRISETLTLEQDCLIKRKKCWVIREYQYKTRKPIYKPVNDEIMQLIKKSIEYTTEHFGKQKYIFVYDQDPTQPMRYTKIQYHLMTMINDNNLCDDDGELFGVGTHMFRHSYGKKMTEMNVDDYTIAKLLGHSGTSSVKYYRKYGNQALADATKNVRKSLDEIISTYAEEW